MIIKNGQKETYATWGHDDDNVKKNQNTQKLKWEKTWTPPKKSSKIK